MQVVQVFLIHRYQLLTEAIVGSLGSDGRVECVGTAESLDPACERLRSLDADVVVVDASLGHREACETLREIKESFPEIHLVYLGNDSSEEVLDFIEAGASGYVSREASLAELIETLEAVSNRQTPCSPRVAASVLARIEELAAQRPKVGARKLGPRAQLTPRETEVLQLVAAGLRNKEIAQQLEIKLPTVKNHVHKILDKLQVRHRREAIRFAYENGLLADPLPRPSYGRG